MVQKFLQDASLDGVKIVRENKFDKIIDEKNYSGEKGSTNLVELSNQDSLNIKTEINPFIEFGVDIKQILKTNGSQILNII